MIGTENEYIKTKNGVELKCRSANVERLRKQVKKLCFEIARLNNHLVDLSCLFKKEDDVDLDFSGQANSGYIMQSEHSNRFHITQSEHKNGSIITQNKHQNDGGVYQEEHESVGIVVQDKHKNEGYIYQSGHKNTGEIK